MGQRFLSGAHQHSSSTGTLEHTVCTLDAPLANCSSKEVLATVVQDGGANIANDKGIAPGYFSNGKLGFCAAIIASPPVFVIQ